MKTFNLLSVFVLACTLYATEGASDCNEKRQQNQDRRVLGAFIPECDENGDYAAKQCHQSTKECWCASKTGNKTSNKVQGDINCASPCFQKRRVTIEGPPGTKVPTCNEDENGGYAPVQCWASTGMCWCSDIDGNQLTDPVRAQPNCE